MFSLRSIVLIAAAFVAGAESSAVPAVAAAPLVAPAHVGYAHAVPQNIPPYAAQVNVVSKALNPVFPAAAVAAPLAAAPVAPLAAAPVASFAAPIAAPYAASYAAAPFASAPFASAPYAAAPYFAGPAPYAYPAAAAYGAPFPYAASLVRAPLGLAPAFVR